MKQPENYPRWMFIILPALAMMLGWGLRGHIGGGPFGAMIPGAMLAMSLSLILKAPAAAASVILVFGVYGIGIGGQMTYGQTVGFLLNPETLWWGTLGLTLKGAMWGLLGGTVLSLAFIYRRLSNKLIILSLLLMVLGMFVGIKLINDPMILYFSNPENPRRESWAGLLFGAAALITYLKLKTNPTDFKVTGRFAILGMIGGGLGFGLGGFWMVLGTTLPDLKAIDWWKGMEFTFGFLLGASLGYAAWLSRKELKTGVERDWAAPALPYKSAYKELGIILLAVILTYWAIPYPLRQLAAAVSSNDGFIYDALINIARIMSTYAFRGGLIFVLIIMLLPKMGWQIGITITFCHGAIDLIIRYFYSGVNHFSIFSIHFLIVILMTTVVAILVAYLNRKENIIRNMFLLLIWSCILVSAAKLIRTPEWILIDGLSDIHMFFRKYLIDIYFVVSGIVISSIIVRKF